MQNTLRASLLLLGVVATITTYKLSSSIKGHIEVRYISGKNSTIETNSTKGTLDAINRIQLFSTEVYPNDNILPLRPKQTFLKQPTTPFNNPCKETTCPQWNNVRWKMVIFVKSTSDHFEQREMVRRTWGALRYLNGAQFHTVFVCGRTSDEKNDLMLKTEHDRYGDILQYDGPDGYKNITLKTLAGMQWAKDNLPNDTYYATSDDDVLVNIKDLKGQVDAANDTATTKGWSAFPLLCSFKKMMDESPHRHSQSKWYISRELYGWHSWPSSCYGGFYTTTVYIASRLYDESRAVQMLHLDDVWITGILRQRLGMPDDMLFKPGSPNTVKHLNKGANRLANWQAMARTMKNDNICRC